jgi:hypothetical protein
LARSSGAYAVGKSASIVEKVTAEKSQKKKSRARSPAQKLCRPFYLEKLGLILIYEATLLVRVRAPPETWTTRLEPFDQPEPERVDHLFPLVTIFSNDCSKFQQSAK